MKHEVHTYPISLDQLHEELRHFIEYFSRQGRGTCLVLFGFAWGNRYYPGKEWNPEVIELRRLTEKIDAVEAAEYGRFGGDDLFLEFPGLTFLFCHESDIHIYFASPDADVEDFFQRWKSKGFRPCEWIYTEDHGPREKIREG